MVCDACHLSEGGECQGEAGCAGSGELSSYEVGAPQDSRRKVLQGQASADSQFPVREVPAGDNRRYQDIPAAVPAVCHLCTGGTARDNDCPGKADAEFYCGGL